MMDRFWIGPENGNASCTSSGGSSIGTPVTYCDDNVPDNAWNDNYPSVISTCTSYQQGTPSIVYFWGVWSIFQRFWDQNQHFLEVFGTEMSIF